MHSFLSVNSSFFPGASDGNESDCASNPYVYAAAFANQFGPTDLGTVKCLFTLAFSSDSGKTKENEILYLGLPVGCIIGIFGAVLVVWVVGEGIRNVGRGRKLIQWRGIWFRG